MQIKLSNQILDEFKLINHEYLVYNRYYDNKSGENEYRLYSYLTTFFNNPTILDIGTFYGRSAISLSYNETNNVISYNLIDQIKNNKHKIYTKQNLEFRIKNVLEDLNKEMIDKTKIIMIDIDHYKVIEEQILGRLRELNFSGIILLDDIHHPIREMRIPMEELWNNIPEKKYDVTKYGHISGTGLIIFGDEPIEIILE